MMKFTGVLAASTLVMFLGVITTSSEVFTMTILYYIKSNCIELSFQMNIGNVLNISPTQHLQTHLQSRFKL